MWEFVPITVDPPSQHASGLISRLECADVAGDPRHIGSPLVDPTGGAALAVPALPDQWWIESCGMDIPGIESVATGRGLALGGLRIFGLAIAGSVWFIIIPCICVC